MVLIAGRLSRWIRLGGRLDHIHSRSLSGRWRLDTSRAIGSFSNSLIRIRNSRFCCFLSRAVTVISLIMYNRHFVLGLSLT